VQMDFWLESSAKVCGDLLQTLHPPSLNHFKFLVNTNYLD
jgi:hypothetical protein